MKRRLLLFFILFGSFAFAQNNIYRSGGITQTVGAPTFTPGASGNIVAIDTVTGEWYVNPNRLSGASWISAGYRLTNISGSVPPAYTPTAHQSHFVVNAANQLYYWNGSSWQSVGGGGGGSTDALRLKFIVVNKSGGTLNKGEVVYVSGAQGNRVAVKKALASVDSLSANTLGVMDETVANNSEGYCVAEGLVSGINTSAFTEGAALYLSPTTAGGITQTKTTAPNHLVLIGYCVKSNAGSGEISVHIQNGYELDELHDVYLPAPSNGQVLTYNSTNKRWEAATVADQSATNEGIIGVSAGSATTSVITSNTSGANGVTVSAGTGISLSETTSTNGGTITVTNSAPDQTVSISNGGGVGITGSYPSFTLTATDQSATNELQTIDTFSLSGQTLSASLSSDNQPAKTVTLPIVDVVAGTNVTVTKSNGVATVSATGGGGGTPAGSTGEIQYNNAGAFAASSNLAWDNSNVQLNIGAPLSPTGKINVKGQGTTSSTVNLRLTNSGNTELLKVLDNGDTNIGTTFNLSGANKTIGIGSSAPTVVRLGIAGIGNSSATYPIYITNLSNSDIFYATDDRRCYFGGANFLRIDPISELVNIISNSSNTDRGLQINQHNSGPQGSTLVMRKSRGTNTSPSNVVLGDFVGAVGYSAYVSGAYTLDRSLFGAGMTSTTGISQFFCTGTTNSNYTPTLLIAENGNVGVGSIGGTIITSLTLPSAKLHICGSNTLSTDYSLIVTNSGGSTTTPAICAQNNQKVGIGTNSVDSGATLEVDGTTGGILFPRLTTTQRDALTPTNGLVIYNSTTNKLQVYAGGAWVDLH